MIKRCVSVWVILLSASLYCAGQEIAFPDVEGFKKVTDYPVYTPVNLWDFIDGAADNYLAFGFADLHIAEYRKGRDVIKAEIYRHSDHTMAFGIYAAERSPSYRFVNMGAQGYINEGIINFFKGNYYVKIRTFTDKDKILKAEVTLASRIADMLHGETGLPAMLSLFPDEGKKKNEEAYINESVLGHEFLKEAFKATYESGTDNFSIYLIKSRSSADALATAGKYLKSAGLDAEESDNGKYVFADGYNGTIFLSWKEDTIVIISGLAKDQADIAERYTSEILK